MTTKEKILIAALELASEQGLGSVSLSQIAEKVGIKKPSLYNHFASKDEIVDELYEYLRKQAKEKVAHGMIDYGELVKNKSALEILTQIVNGYITMNQDPDMERFYKFVMSERSIHKQAARIMLMETEKMILATKQLFYAMQVQHIMEFDNADMAAFSFAMAVHSCIDYMFDQRTAGGELTAENMLEDYLKEFCCVYGRKR